MASSAIAFVNALGPDMPPVHASALADTGAMMLCIPSSIASRLQLETADHRPATLADGLRVSVPYVDPGSRARRMAWSDLLCRVFAVDALRCDRCGGRMRVMAAIRAPASGTAFPVSKAAADRAPPGAAEDSASLG